MTSHASQYPDSPERGDQPTARTTASEGQSCSRCGGPLKRRRRNDFCSDRCRMADRREREAAGRRALLDRLARAVADVEREFGKEAAARRDTDAGR